MSLPDYLLEDDAPEWCEDHDLPRPCLDCREDAALAEEEGG